MSLLLARSIPTGTEVKTHHADTGIGICLGKYEFEHEDFASLLQAIIEGEAKRYILTDEDSNAIDCFIGERGVIIGSITIPLSDFVFMTQYIMINTNLEIDDPRSVVWASAKAQLKNRREIGALRDTLICELAKLCLVDGYEPNTKRLGLPEEVK